MKFAKDCRIFVISAFALIVFSACGKPPEQDHQEYYGASPSVMDGGSQAELPAPTPVPSPEPSPPPSQEPVPLPQPVLNGPPTVWNHVSASTAWNAAVLGTVRANLPKFEKARDRELFCPGYSSATDAQRLTCWSRLISVIVQFESGFNQNSVYHEPSGGKDSVGLMMLSQGECSNAPTVAKLKNGVENLKCGAARMAMLIERDGYVTSPDNKHGAAAYWSVLRAPYTAYGLKLGKRNEILKLSKKYREVYPIVDF